MEEAKPTSSAHQALFSFRNKGNPLIFIYTCHLIHLDLKCESLINMIISQHRRVHDQAVQWATTTSQSRFEDGAAQLGESEKLFVVFVQLRKCTFGFTPSSNEVTCHSQAQSAAPLNGRRCAGKYQVGPVPLSPPGLDCGIFLYLEGDS